MEVEQGEQVEAGVDMICAGIDMLLKADPTPLSSVRVTAALAKLETQRHRLEPVDQTLLAQIVSRGIAGEYGRTSPTDLLVELLRVTPGEAKARLRRAAELGPRQSLTGLALEPILPATSEALAAGAISAAHADVIIRAVQAIPDDLQAEFGVLVEHALVDQARHTHPGLVARAAQHLLERIDPDGRAPKDEEIQRRREFAIRTRPDGSAVASGYLTPECAAVWQTIIDTLGKPQPAEDDTPDPRTAGQRRHDAFLDAGKRLLRSDLPTTGGAPVTILVLMRIEDFLTGTGSAQTSRGDRIAVTDLLRTAADTQVIPVLLSDTGGILSYGQTRRLASCQQRLALAARDRGCSFPDCTRPPAWCEAHHVIAWADGGPTDLDNLTLLCGYHHRNFEALGWACHITAGVPHWTPPKWLDPDRQPRRNTANHIEINFDSG